MKNQYQSFSREHLRVQSQPHLSTRQMCQICSKLTIKKPERRQWLHSGVFNVALNKFHTFF